MFLAWKNDANVSSERTREYVLRCGSQGEASGGASAPPVARDAAVSLPPALPGVPPARPLGKRASLVQGKKKVERMGEHLAWLLSSLRPISSGGRKKTAVCVGPR